MYVCMYVCIHLYLSEFTKTDPKNIKLKVNIVFTPPHPYPPHPTPTHPQPKWWSTWEEMPWSMGLIFIFMTKKKSKSSLITTQDVHFYAKNKSPLTCKSKTYSTHPLSFDYTNPFATHPWKSRQLSCMWLLAMTLSPLHFLWPDSYEGGQCLLSIENYAMSIELSFPKACFWQKDEILSSRLWGNINSSFKFKNCATISKIILK